MSLSILPHFVISSDLMALIGEGNGNPLQYSCWENPVDRRPGGLQFISLRESDMTEVTDHACKNMWIDKTILENLFMGG